MRQWRQHEETWAPSLTCGMTCRSPSPVCDSYAGVLIGFSEVGPPVRGVVPNRERRVLSGHGGFWWSQQMVAEALAAPAPTYYRLAPLLCLCCLWRLWAHYLSPYVYGLYSALGLPDPPKMTTTNCFQLHVVSPQNQMRRGTFECVLHHSFGFIHPRGRDGNRKDKKKLRGEKEDGKILRERQ